MSWVGEDSNAWIVEEMTEEGQVYRLEGGNKGGRYFSCGEVGHMAGSCTRNAFPAGKLDICHFSVEEVPCVSIAESWVTRQYHAQN